MPGKFTNYNATCLVESTSGYLNMLTYVSRVARDYLAIPATLASSEYYFCHVRIKSQQGEAALMKILCNQAHECLKKYGGYKMKYYVWYAHKHDNLSNTAALLGIQALNSIHLRLFKVASYVSWIEFQFDIISIF
jgi:hypothetical protein